MLGSSDSQTDTIFGKNTASYSISDRDHKIKYKLS